MNFKKMFDADNMRHVEPSFGKTSAEDLPVVFRAAFEGAHEHLVDKIYEHAQQMNRVQSMLFETCKDDLTEQQQQILNPINYMFSFMTLGLTQLVRRVIAGAMAGALHEGLLTSQQIEEVANETQHEFSKLQDQIASIYRALQKNANASTDKD
jgi:hypothetical protein